MVPDPDKLWLALADIHLWGVIAVAGTCGALGALLHPPPAPPADVTDGPEPTAAPRSRGWDILAGAIAAVAALYVTSADSGLTLVSGSLIAGYGANAVLAGLQARMTAAIATGRAAASARLAAERTRQAEAATRLSEQRVYEALQARRDLDELVHAAETGRDIQQCARDIRARRTRAADSPPPT